MLDVKLNGLLNISNHKSLLDCMIGKCRVFAAGQLASDWKFIMKTSFLLAASASYVWFAQPANFMFTTQRAAQHFICDYAYSFINLFDPISYRPHHAVFANIRYTLIRLC